MARSKPAGSGRRTYHHGDLRNALVRAAIAILEREGLNALTLRGAATQAGVSHAAPAHHFRSLKGLLTAVAAEGFRRFYAALERAMREVQPSPVGQLRAAGQAYVAFALENAAVVQLMFSGARLDWTDPDLCVAADRADAQLLEIVRPAADRLGALNDIDRRELALMVWSNVHGYAHLAITGALDRGPGHVRPPIPDLPGVLFGQWRPGWSAAR
jgi:AcrR family transcriptional regulator